MRKRQSQHLSHPNKIEIKFTQKEDYTLIYSKGRRSTFSESTGVAEDIVKKMLDIPVKKLLLDYRETYYDIPPSDAYNLIKVFELKLTAFKSFSMAVVVNEEIEEFGNFWASVGQQRGFNFAVFLDFQEAEEWIKVQ